MMTSEKDTEQNEELNEKQKPPVSMAGRVAATGFCGGVLWSFVAYIAYLFHFSEISPNMILQMFVLGEWKTWAGNGNQHHFNWSNFNWRAVSLFSSIETFKNNVAGYFIRLGALICSCFLFLIRFFQMCAR